MTQKVVKQHVVIVPRFDNPDDVGTVGIGLEMLRMFVSIGDGLRRGKNPVAVMCRPGEEEGILGNFTLKPDELRVSSRLEIWDDMADLRSFTPKEWMNRAGSLRAGSFIFMYLEHAESIGLPPHQLVPGAHPVELKVRRTAKVSGRMVIPGVPANLPVLAKRSAASDFDPRAETVKDDPELQAARDKVLQAPDVQEAVRKLEESFRQPGGSNEPKPKKKASRIIPVLVLMTLLALAAAGAYLQQ